MIGVALGDEVAVAGRRTDRGQRRELAVRAVEGEERVEVDVADAVAPRQQEGVVADPRREPLDATTGVGLGTGVDDRDAPVLAPVIAAVVDDLARPGPDRDVAGQAPVVDGPALDRLALVARGDDELVVTEAEVVAHDVPQDRPAADLHHRLRPDDRLLGEPAPESAGQDRCLHGTTLHSQRHGRLGLRKTRPARASRADAASVGAHAPWPGGALRPARAPRPPSARRAR